mmetsp:Transcript_115493/g.331498  ORF Transcript_115493/g.331498 Transcript_115493/m.331498 type:complete len:229 (+) Transcript_115493:656-1342(+)
MNFTSCLSGASGISSLMRSARTSRTSRKLEPSSAYRSTGSQLQRPCFDRFIMTTASTSPLLASMLYRASVCACASTMVMKPLRTSIRWPPEAAATTKMRSLMPILIFVKSTHTSSPNLSPEVALASPECVTAPLMAVKLLWKIASTILPLPSTTTTCKSRSIDLPGGLAHEMATPYLRRSRGKAKVSFIAAPRRGALRRGPEAAASPWPRNVPAPWRAALRGPSSGGT